jgi:regulator of sirC expression with transglutaminase-like and TPR domain
MLTDREIKALIMLLDDSDTEVVEHVADKLISIGERVIPTLEKAWENEKEGQLQKKIEDIIHSIQFTSLQRMFSDWMEKKDSDLLTGFFLVSKYYYPNLQLEDIEKQIFKIKQRIWLELNYNQTSLEQVQIFNQVFYNIHRFTSAQGNLDFQEFCLNHLLETKTGNAISLGILYQIIANDLNLPIYGVTLLRHYILCFCKRTISNFQPLKSLEKEVIFYINPVNKGSIFSRSEITDYLEKLNAPPHPQYYSPANNYEIIHELLSNLIDLHTHVGAREKGEELNALRKKLEFY